jgi:hypothetical protein
VARPPLVGGLSRTPLFVRLTGRYHQVGQTALVARARNYQHLSQPVETGEPLRYGVSRILVRDPDEPVADAVHGVLGALPYLRPPLLELFEFYDPHLVGVHEPCLLPRETSQVTLELLRLSLLEVALSPAGRRVEPGKHGQSTPTRAAVCRSASILHFGRDGDRRLFISLDHLGLPYPPRSGSLSKFPEGRRERSGCSPG